MNRTPEQSHYILDTLLKTGKVKEADIPSIYPDNDLRVFADWLYTFYTNEEVASGQAGEKWMKIAEAVLQKINATAEDLYMLSAVIPVLSALDTHAVDVACVIAGKRGSTGPLLNKVIEETLQSFQTVDKSSTSQAVDSLSMQPDQESDPL